jgi:ATP phosphoribosyltransferase
MTFQLDPANATTGLLLDYINDSGFTCLVRLGLYFVTAADTPKCVRAEIAATATTGANLVANTQTAVATTVFWSTLVPVFLDNYHLSVWAINTGVDTGIVATGIVGYAVVELWPVCAVV